MTWINSNKLDGSTHNTPNTTPSTCRASANLPASLSKYPTPTHHFPYNNGDGYHLSAATAYEGLPVRYVWCYRKN